MNRPGHVGIALLAYAPISYLLLDAGYPVLAVVGLLGVLLVEPLPDSDHRIPWLAHRGTSHSLCCVLLVGIATAGIGWVVGDSITELATIVGGVTGSEEAHLSEQEGTVYAVGGFAIGAIGVLVHLLADVITVAGIRPLLPVSHRRVSVAQLRADSAAANTALFALGSLALIGVVVRSVLVA